MKLVFHQVENIVEKGESAVYQKILVSSIFSSTQKAFPWGSLKPRIVW